MEALGPQGTAVFFCCLSYYILRKCWNPKIEAIKRTCDLVIGQRKFR